MKKLLEKIAWKTRKWNFGFKLFNLLLHDQQGSWGFKLFTLNLYLKEYSLLAFNFRLPNKTTVRQFAIDEWDVLFLYNYLWKKYDKLSDNVMWRYTRNNSWVVTTKWERIQLKIYNKLFK